MEKIKCRVCGFEFNPVIGDHYIAREDMKAVVFVKDPGEPSLYDAWDCPVCGAQFAVEGRKRTVEEEPEGPVGVTVTFGGPGAVSIGNGGNGKPYEDLDAEVQEACGGCEYEKLGGHEEPCNICSRCYWDRYREAKKDGAE